MQAVVAFLMWVQMLQATIVSNGNHIHARHSRQPYACVSNACVLRVVQAVVALLMWVQMLQATIVSTPMVAFTLQRALHPH